MKKSRSNSSEIKKKNILGVEFSDINFPQVLEYTEEKLEKNDKNLYFVTPNPEILVLSVRDDRYKKVLNLADLALADGIGVILASKLLGNTIKTRIPGADLVENLCFYAADRPITVGFLGGGPRVAEKVSECLMKKYPGLKSSLSFQGNPDDKTLKTIKKIVGEKNNNKKIDILFVAFGSPKQEIWINDNLKNLPAKITIGVGGAFDFISGEVRRAPSFIRRIGLEWLFRLMIQPWRIKRQLALLTFSYLVFKEWLFDKNS